MNLRTIAIACAVTIGAAMCCGCSKLPSDEEIIGRFHDDRETFETLASMMVADQLSSVSILSDSTMRAMTPSPNGPNKTRLETYGELMSSIGIDDVEERQGEYRFPLAEARQLYPVATKGVVYCRPGARPACTEPDRRRQELDSYRRTDGLVYRHIDGPWYLYSKPAGGM